MKNTIKIIAAVSEKGGVGKTTLLTNLATYYASQGESVLLCDLDPQKSAVTWGKVRESRALEAPRIEIETPKTLTESLGALHDRVLIDVAGSDGESLRAALLYADLIMIPSLVGGFSFLTASHTFDLVCEAQMIREKLKDSKPLKARLLLNGVRKNSVGLRELRNHWSSNSPIPLLKTELSSLDDFWGAAQEGLGVVEMNPQGQAAKQVKALAKEIGGLA